MKKIRKGWSKLEDAEEQFRQYEQDWGAPVWDFEFRLRNGVIHFHVWTQDEVVRLLQYMGLKIVAVAESVPERTDSFVVVARKPPIAVARTGGVVPHQIEVALKDRGRLPVGEGGGLTWLRRLRLALRGRSRSVFGR